MGKGDIGEGECKDKAHYWILDDRNLGVCKRCGARRQFLFHGWHWQNRKFIVSKKSHSTAD